MNRKLIQEIIDDAVKIATREAMYGTPCKRIMWFPPPSATEERHGIFVVEREDKLSASDTPSWER